MWARTGREIFYRSPTGAMMSAAVQLQPQLSIGTVTKLFEGPDYLGARPGFASGNPARQYDATADASRFLMVRQPANTRDATRIIVIENWFEELKERLK